MKIQREIKEQKMHPDEVHILLAMFYYDTVENAQNAFLLAVAQSNALYIYIYIYAVKLLSGPSLAILGVIIWAK